MLATVGDGTGDDVFSRISFYDSNRSLTSKPWSAVSRSRLHRALDLHPSLALQPSLEAPNALNRIPIPPSKSKAQKLKGTIVHAKTLKLLISRS